MATLAQPLPFVDFDAPPRDAPAPATPPSPIAVRADAGVIRVVAGRLAGKEYPLAEGQRICIGHGLANDVVLRGSGTRGTVVELCCNNDTALLRVVEGSAELLGRTLATGEEAQLPPYLPFRLGEFVLAHGAPDSARWEEAERVAGSRAAAPVLPLPAPKLSDRIAQAGRERLRDVGERVRGPRLAIAAVSGLLLVAAAGLLHADFSARQKEPASVEDELADAGIKGLTVTRGGAGGLVVTGVVANEGDLQRVRALAADASVPVTVNAETSEGLADSAEEILRAQGVDAAVEPAAGDPRALTVSAQYMPGDKQDEVREMLQGDLPALAHVNFRVDDARGGNALQTFFAASGTGMATLVADPGYIVTADGARWFPGAVLPTGHRLVSIENGTVRFEKDGRTEDLRL